MLDWLTWPADQLLHIGGIIAGWFFSRHTSVQQETAALQHFNPGYVAVGQEHRISDIRNISALPPGADVGRTPSDRH
jgi:hypothetical protein